MFPFCVFEVSAELTQEVLDPSQVLLSNALVEILAFLSATLCELLALPQPAIIMFPNNISDCDELTAPQSNKWL